MRNRKLLFNLLFTISGESPKRGRTCLRQDRFKTLSIDKIVPQVRGRKHVTILTNTLHKAPIKKESPD